MSTKKKAVKITEKPFVKGSASDENTIRQSLKFFGILFLTAFMTFLVCSLTSFKSLFPRILVNTAIELLVLYIFFTKGAELGTEAVSRGEILYQHIEKGILVSESERKIPFHSLKGYLIGFIGTIPFLVFAIILALTAKRQMTGYGTLPSWMEPYMRRSEISGALVQYTQTTAISLTDIVRIVVRLLIMPFVSMIGAENKDLLLIAERLSPLLIFLPALSYGTGYLQGPARRTKVHSQIAEGRRRRISREKREKKARTASIPREPEQLN